VDGVWVFGERGELTLQNKTRPDNGMSGINPSRRKRGFGPPYTERRLLAISYLLITIAHTLSHATSPPKTCIRRRDNGTSGHGVGQKKKKKNHGPEHDLFRVQRKAG
jgi:hypothetical protein